MIFTRYYQLQLLIYIIYNIPIQAGAYKLYAPCLLHI